MLNDREEGHDKERVRRDGHEEDDHTRDSYERHGKEEDDGDNWVDDEDNESKSIMRTKSFSIFFYSFLPSFPPEQHVSG